MSASFPTGGCAFCALGCGALYLEKNKQCANGRISISGQVPGLPAEGSKRGVALQFLSASHIPQSVCLQEPLAASRSSPVQPAPTPSFEMPHFQIPDPSQEPPRGIPNPSACRELRSSWRGTRRGPLVTSKERAEMLGATRAGPGSWQSQTDFQVPSRPPKTPSPASSLLARPSS